MFETYDTIAVGITGNGKYGWVSLSSLEGLTRFIQDINGKELKGETWAVVSKYNPSLSVIPTTRIQLSTAKQAAQEAEREKKAA
ncbi:hypothetical protein F4808DRAFT_350101 [Astrocystis sublimbata]|nr:hypothetical protein F4808DRAFT_350101 [Astrocystis sublimbata]